MNLSIVIEVIGICLDLGFLNPAIKKHYPVIRE